MVTIEPTTFDKRRLLKYSRQLENEHLVKIRHQLRFYLNL